MRKAAHRKARCGGTAATFCNESQQAFSMSDCGASKGKAGRDGMPALTYLGLVVLCLPA